MLIALAVAALVNLPGEVNGDAVLCSIDAEPACFTVTDPLPVRVVSEVRGETATVVYRGQTFQTDYGMVSVVYKGCALSLRSYDLKSYCPGVR